VLLFAEVVWRIGIPLPEPPRRARGIENLYVIGMDEAAGEGTRRFFHDNFAGSLTKAGC